MLSAANWVVDFFVSVDETTLDARITLPLITGACSAHDLPEGLVRMHRYTEMELEEESPALKELREKLPNGSLDIPGKNGDRSMAWMFHCEAISHWFRRLPSKD